MRIIDLDLKLHTLNVVSKKPTVVIYNNKEMKLSDIKYVAKTSSKNRRFYENTLAALEGVVQ